MQQVKDLVVKINENKDYTAKKIAECFKNGVTFTDEQDPHPSSAAHDSFFGRVNLFFSCFHGE
jgi:hypothetical protein